MKILPIKGNIDGMIYSSPSKSQTHRAIFLASLANGTSIIRNPLISQDTVSTINACKAIGATIIKDKDALIVEGGNIHPTKNTIDVQNSGTTLRILAGISSMLNGETTIVGDLSVEKRPMEHLLKSLSKTGMSYVPYNNTFPLVIKGGNKGGNINIEGNISSQFITSIMIVSPLLVNDSEIQIDGQIVSSPYIDMTASMMSEFGATVTKRGNFIKIKGNTGYSSHDYTISADFSSAAFPLVAGALKGKVTIKGLNENNQQGDKQILDILKKSGASISIDNDEITVSNKDIVPLDIDMKNIPDLFPIISVLLCGAKGISRLYGAPHLKFKESNRIDSTVCMLKSLGANIEKTDDGCLIHGNGKLKGGIIAPKGDHRIMMAGSVASLLCEEPVKILEDALNCISYPEFYNDMKQIGFEMEEI